LDEYYWQQKPHRQYLPKPPTYPTYSGLHELDRIENGRKTTLITPLGFQERGDFHTSSIL
jgi:hypothetical protein